MRVNPSLKPTLRALALASLGLLAGQAWASMSCEYNPAPAANTVFTINNVLDVTQAELRRQVPFAIKCKKRNANINGTFCLRVGLGSAGTMAGSNFAPRWLKRDATYGIGFNIHKNANYNEVWGSLHANQIRKSPDMTGSTSASDWWINMGGGSGKSNYFVSYPLYMEILPTFPAVGGVSSIHSAAPGTYTSVFNDNANTGWRMGFGTSVNNDCSNGSDNSEGTYYFTVTANIAAQCKITKPANIDFGDQPSSATNLQGNTSLGVQCTNTTPYTIALQPSNNNGSGTGQMIGQDPSNSGVTLPYQLRKASGMAGAAWGNNGGGLVSATGTAAVQNYPIYATIASADYPAGEYQDTVTITVTY